MPIATHTFRVFVSSTFEDLKAERDALQRDVFPKLRTLCEQHGARFQAIDLRWGVREEAGLDQKTMEICLSEIARCQKTGIKPNFIVLPGDRYGWCPLPAMVDKDEFNAVLSHVADLAEENFIRSWYDLDYNAVTPQYVLRPRREKYNEWREWEPIERRVQGALRSGASVAGLAAASMVKYVASATHQEILRGLGESWEDRKHVYAYFREPQGPVDSDLARLKKHLGDALPADNIFSFPPGGIDQLCDAVEGSLKASITATAERFEPLTEKSSHDRIAGDLAEQFIGREAVLHQIEEYIHSDNRNLLAVYGPGGCGKSALMAKASDGRPAVRRFVGTTPECSSSIGLLSGLCKEISEVYGELSDVPVTFRELLIRFQELLGLASPSRPLVLFIDAIDQIDVGDPAPVAQWLPKRLPPYCRIVASTTEVHEALREATQVRIDPFDEKESEQVLDRWLAKSHRTLQHAQRVKVLEAVRPTGLPLYLRLAFEEAKLWRSFDPSAECSLGDSLPQMLERMLERLSQSSNHGSILVRSALGYLAAARYGLTESEILDVLTEDRAVWNDVVGEGERRRHDPPVRQLPDIVWSRLFFDLRHFLHERLLPGGVTIGLQDRQLATSVLRSKGYHHGLARYFGNAVNWVGRYTGATESLDAGGLSREPNYRKMQELPYQLAHGALWPALELILTDLDFIEAKCAAGLSHDIVADYAVALRGEDPTATRSVGNYVLGEFRKFVSDDAAWLSLHPELVLQQALNLPESMAPCKAAASGTFSGIRKPWMRRINKHEERSFKRALPSVGCRPVRGAVATGERILAIGDELGFLSIYDLGAMTKLYETPLGDLVPTACAFGLPSGRVLVGTSGGKLLLVDAQGGTILGEWLEHTAAVLSLVVNTATGEALSTSMDHSARIWKWREDRLVRSEEIFRGTFPVLSGAFVVDGEGVALGGADGRLNVLERASGWRAIFSNWIHDGAISFCGVTDSGTILWTAGSDRKISVTGVRWDRPVTPFGSWRLAGEVLSFSTWQNSPSCIIGQYGSIAELPMEGSASILNECQQSVCFAGVLKDGEGIVAVEGDGSVSVLARKSFRRQEDRLVRSVDALVWMADGGRLCALSEPETDGGIYDLRSSHPLEAAIYDPESNRFDPRSEFPGYFLSDTAICATAGYLLLRTHFDEDESGVHVIDLQDMRRVGFLPTGERPRSIFVDSAGRVAATVGNRGAFTVWSLEALTPNGAERQMKKTTESGTLYLIPIEGFVS